MVPAACATPCCQMATFLCLALCWALPSFWGNGAQWGTVLAQSPGSPCSLEEPVCFLRSGQAPGQEGCSGTGLAVSVAFWP